MGLKGIVRFKWRDVGMIEFDGSTAESCVRISALTIQTLAGSEGCHDFVGLVVSYELQLDVGVFRRVSRAHRVGGGFGRFKSLRYSERNILSEVANDIIFEWRP